MKKRIMSLLMSVIMVASMLAGCGSEAGGGARKGDTMTVSEMFKALVEDNGGEAIMFASKANSFNKEVSESHLTSNVSISRYDGKTRYVYKEKCALGEILSGEVKTDDLGGISRESEFQLCLVTDDDENVLYETTTENSFKFEGANIYRINVDGTTFIVIATPRPTDNLNPYDHLLFEETESMVGKTIVMDTIGAEGVGVNLED